MWITSEAHIRWIDRNEAVHGVQENEATSKRRMEAVERVKSLYSMKEEMSTNDWKILDMPLQRRLTHNTIRLVLWADLVTPTIKVCIKMQKERVSRGQLDIRAFVQTNKKG